ncbi:MAG TPA: hypothetical protein VFF94_07725, partial [Novosphingobium sp.]|nr:hypothetical protein [Novosphingobium sp.]
MIWAGALATGGWLAGSGMAAPPQRAEEHAPPRPGHSPYQLPLRPLDAWVYRQNWQRETDTAAPAGKGERRLSVTIMATAGDRARVSLTEMGAASPAIEETVNADWSCAAPGTQGHWLTSRPLALPLWPGKMWEADYTARTPADPSHTRETIRQHY